MGMAWHLSHTVRACQGPASPLQAHAGCDPSQQSSQTCPRQNRVFVLERKAASRSQRSRKQNDMQTLRFSSFGPQPGSRTEGGNSRSQEWRDGLHQLRAPPRVQQCNLKPGPAASSQGRAAGPSSPPPPLPLSLPTLPPATLKPTCSARARCESPAGGDRGCQTCSVQTSAHTCSLSHALWAPWR